MSSAKPGITRSAVLAYIGARGGASRAELARVLNASPALLTQVTRELLADGLIRVSVVAPSSGGRPAQLLELTQSAVSALGVKIATDHITAVEVDIAGNIIRSRREAFDSLVPTALGDAAEFMREFIDSSAKNTQVLGIGIGVPGDVDAQDSGVVESTLLGWSSLPLGERLRNELNMPVLVENNVNALALAQGLYGQMRTFKNTITVTLGEGVGAGIIVDEQLVRGRRGGAGDLGHLPMGDPNARCQCGNNGCLEALIGEKALVEQAIVEGVIDVSGTINDLVIEASVENPNAVAIYTRASGLFGRAVATMVNLLDPDAVAISGEGAGSWHLWEAGFEEAFRAALVPSKRGISVIVEPWQDDRWAQGAATLILNAPFDTYGTSGKEGEIVRERLSSGGKEK